MPNDTIEFEGKTYAISCPWSPDWIGSDIPQFLVRLAQAPRGPREDTGNPPAVGSPQDNTHVQSLYAESRKERAKRRIAKLHASIERRRLAMAAGAAQRSGFVWDGRTGSWHDPKVWWEKRLAQAWERYRAWQKGEAAWQHPRVKSKTKSKQR